MNDNHDRLIELLREADPAGTEDAGTERREAVRGRALRKLAAEGATAGSEKPRKGLVLGVSGAAAAAVVAAWLLVFGGGPVGPAPSGAYAEAAIRIAEANPRLLVGEPGWNVSFVDEFELDSGQIDFEGSGERLSVYWLPESQYTAPDIESLRQGARGREGSFGNPITPGPGEPRQLYDEVTAMGRKGVLSYTSENTRFSLWLAPQDGMALRVDGWAPNGEMTRERFMAIVDSLYRTDVDSWLAALPPRIVRPEDHEDEVDGMLAGLPVPESVDVEALRSEDLAMTRYHLGARVTSAVACGWLDQWAAAVRRGDTAEAKEASDAMATSRDWPILREMEEQGGWSQVIWEYAREMASDNRSQLLGVAGTETTGDGIVYELSPAYAVGIGCDSAQRTRRPGRAEGPLATTPGG